MAEDASDLPLGERIRLHRWRLGMPQATLAHRIGKSKRWMVEVESGRADNLRVQDIFELARALKMDVATLTDNAFSMPDQPPVRQSGALSGFGTLFIEHDAAVLTYSHGLYRPFQRRRLFNAGQTPVTRFLVRIHVDRFPGDPDRSNRLYREHPLTWDELAFTATCGDEPMTWTVKHDRDAFKELYLRFESPDGHRFPLYPGERTTIDYLNACACTRKPTRACSRSIMLSIPPPRTARRAR